MISAGLIALCVSMVETPNEKDACSNAGKAVAVQYKTDDEVNRRVDIFNSKLEKMVPKEDAAVAGAIYTIFVKKEANLNVGRVLFIQKLSISASQDQAKLVMKWDLP